MTIIGIGVDIVEISRIESLVFYKREKLAYKILSDNELIQYNNHKYPVRFLAKCFAIKEAASKAFGIGIRNGLTFTQFEVYKNNMGKPSLKLFSKAALLANKLGINNKFITLSDEHYYVCAMVLFEHKDYYYYI